MTDPGGRLGSLGLFGQFLGFAIPLIIVGSQLPRFAGAPAGTCAWAANAAKPNPNVIDINNAFMDSLSDWTPRPMR